jgi:hypothetical protein
MRSLRPTFYFEYTPSIFLCFANHVVAHALFSHARFSVMCVLTNVYAGCERCRLMAMEIKIA